MTDEKKPIDWTEIERDYRTGSMSLRELARWYGISDTAIRKRAKAEGWVRENPEVGSRREPANEPEPKVYVGTVLTPENARPEAIISRGRNLVLRMLDELDASTLRNGELEALIVSSTDEADASGQRAAMLQAISLKQRADVLKALATAAKTLADSGVAAPGGVKAARQAEAEKIAGGRFAPPAPPSRLVQ